ncbi:hypothetical protein RF11_07540 [Thelohanellus kitauei]|uniref:Uncharacterized protein n=1 Tax=Thelohanellus kitauei TaxID=669202 RepID=A0A0C2IYK6_THEKT|nr:hypothetical protein RF11_07540 [Thelohanellus kitauei]
MKFEPDREYCARLLFMVLKMIYHLRFLDELRFDIICCMISLLPPYYVTSRELKIHYSYVKSPKYESNARLIYVHPAVTNSTNQRCYVTSRYHYIPTLFPYLKKHTLLHPLYNAKCDVKGQSIGFEPMTHR